MRKICKYGMLYDFQNVNRPNLMKTFIDVLGSYLAKYRIHACLFV